MVFKSAAQSNRYWYAKSRPDKPELMDEFRDIVEAAEKEDEERRRRDMKSKLRDKMRKEDEEDRRYKKKMEQRLQDIERRHKYSFWRS
jgi:DNA-binding GntR family transcriptional regulator